MVNEDAPDLETLVEDSRNPHAVRQYIAMGDRIATLESQIAEARRQADVLEKWFNEKSAALVVALSERDEAKRVAVWAAQRCAKAYPKERAIWFEIDSSHMTRWGIPVTSIEYDGTDDDLYRAVREAMGEGK